MFCFVLFCFVDTNRAQNLVPNPSFESAINCVSGRLDNAVGWNSVNSGIGINAHLQTCQSDLWVKSPRQYLDNCFQSYQTIRTGNAYTEFGTYINTPGTPESTHPSVKLVDTLGVGKIYCVTYYVSLMNHVNYSIDKLGALLTPTPFPYYVTGTTTPSVAIAGQYTPQVVSDAGVALEDTLGWMEVSGSFIAVGNEAYLTLGDFFLHSQHFIKNSYPTNCNGLAEYYIDDVSVEEVHPAVAKNDTLINQGDSTIIGNNLSEATLYSWQPTTGLSCSACANPKASPSVTTTYTVTKTQCKSITTDVITVTVSPTNVVTLSGVEALIIVPNPTNGLLTITTRYEIEKVDLLNVTGQVLLSEQVKAKSHLLQLQNFAEGIYFVKILYTSGLSLTKKVVKQ